MITISKILNAIRMKFFTLRDLKETIFLSKKVKVIPGTIRFKPDKDDAWFHALSKHSNSIIDIGANIGFNSLIACLSNNTSQVILVEPNPEALSIAAKNLISNNLSNRCRFFPYLLTDKAGEQVKFYTVGAGAAGSIFKYNAHSASALNSYYYIISSTLDNLTEELNIIPDLVKIDVEGAEELVLHGATILAQKKQSRFFVEMHGATEMPMETNAQNILDWCKVHEYKAWYLKEAKPLTNSSTIAHRGRCHLLLQPEEWPYPDYLIGINEGDPLPS